MQKESTARPHSVSLTDRSRLSASGVEDVECFNEDTAVISTAMGEMTVIGAGLKVSELDLNAGNVVLEGRIDSIEYGAAKKGGFFARLFR